MNNNNAHELMLELSNSENQLKTVSDSLSKLLNEIKYQVPNSNISRLIKENNELRNDHKSNENDIKEYKEEVNTLLELQKKNEARILKLSQENEKLKKSKSSNIVKKESKGYSKFIRNLKDLSNKLGFFIKKDSGIEEPKEIQGDQNKIDNPAQKKKLKEEYKKKFNEVKEKSNKINKEIKEQSKILEEYKKCINEVNLYINNYRDKLNVSVIYHTWGEAKENEGKNKQFEEMNNQVKNITSSMAKLEEILFKIKSKFGQNIENILTEIHFDLNDLDKEGNQNEGNYNNLLSNIKHNLDEIQKIFQDYENNKANCNENNHKIQEDMNKLKGIFKEHSNDYKKNQEKNQSIIRQSIVFPSVNNPHQSLNDNVQNEGDNIDAYGSINQSNIPADSFLFKVKDPRRKMELYKTANLFRDSDDLLQINEGSIQLVRRNYHLIIYVYDDYEIYDEYYYIKAMGLGNFQSFSTLSHSCPFDREIELESFSINGNPSEFEPSFSGIMFKLNLRNAEEVKIHIRYKGIKNQSFLSQGQKDEREIYRSDSYYISSIYAGQKAKFSLILKGSYDIVNFSEYLLCRNPKNKDEKEYVWGGIVPQSGINLTIMFSKVEGRWLFNSCCKFQSCFGPLRTSKFNTPIEFIGGNNDIINITPESPQSSNIIIDEEKRQYIGEYRNTSFREAEFCIKCELINRCKGEWLIDLTDEEVEKKMPPEDVRDKAQLQVIARQIIEEFDRENRGSDFEFLDYMKIGLWVHKNINYNLCYSGQTKYSAMDIYNMKAGVCHHMTRLSNALLYSLGYKTIYICGYAVQGEKSFKSNIGHAWSLVKIDQKWYPFDSTWGILTGKLPVGHVFSTYFAKTFGITGSDGAIFKENYTEGKFLG